MSGKPEFVYPAGVARITDEQARVLGANVISYPRGTEGMIPFELAPTSYLLNFAVAKHRDVVQISAGTVPSSWAWANQLREKRKYDAKKGMSEDRMLEEAQKLVPAIMALAKDIEEYTYWRLEKIAQGAMTEPAPLNTGKMF